MTIRDIVKQEVEDYLLGIIVWIIGATALLLLIATVVWFIYSIGYSDGQSQAIRTCAPMVVGLRG